MNCKSLSIISVSVLSLGLGLSAGVSATPNGPQVSKDRGDIKAENGQLSADEKEVKRLSELSTQATGRTRQAHEVYLQKSQARLAAVKSYGGKDPRSQQAAKDEAAAKQDWEARLKEQRDIGVQRKAAIVKLQGANTARGKDVHKLLTDEGQAHPTHPTGTAATPPKK